MKRDKKQRFWTAKKRSWLTVAVGVLIIVAVFWISHWASIPWTFLHTIDVAFGGALVLLGFVGIIDK